MLRGDLPRLARATSIVTESAASPIKRSKPLKYAYEKEIVLYAHHKKLDYFSTECIYSPEAFRGSARALIKNLEKVRPSAILDVVRSGEDMARCVPVEAGGGTGSCRGGCVTSDRGERGAAQVDEEEGDGGCGSAKGATDGGEMAEMERNLLDKERVESEGREVEITRASVTDGQRHDRNLERREKLDVEDGGRVDPGARGDRGKGPARTPKKLQKQQMGQCERCGYLSSQAICKACMLLEGLNRNRPSRGIEVGQGGRPGAGSAVQQISALTVADSNG